MRRYPVNFLKEDYHHQMKMNFYIRLCYEYRILCIVRKLRRKRSERKSANKNQKMKNGNRKPNELKVLSWNSGHTFLINQMNEVK